MKKLFTSLLAATAAFAVWADTPVLLFRGQPVEAGKTYETGYTFEEFDLGGGMTMRSYTQDSHLGLTGIKGAETVLEVKATESVKVCSITGQCTAGSDVTKTGQLGMADVVSEEGNNVTIDLRIDIDNDDYIIEGVTEPQDPSVFVHNVTVEVTAYYAATPNDKATTTVILRNVPDSELNGIAAVDNDLTSVKLGYGNTLEYNAAVPTKLDIYTTSGSLVMSRKIYSTGSISLDSLHPGVYIYSANGTTGKILVRK
ncbi:MAG: T9SS type A sorting domain-containing protein [Muribaculaceae bacterium]|nr:T9SS type A sorting domain-containing protein [Muribaculaceae bacterium]